VASIVGTLVAVSASVLSAAGPASAEPQLSLGAPSVSVSAAKYAGGGWDVSWPAVAGATSYLVSESRPGGAFGAAVVVAGHTGTMRVRMSSWAIGSDNTSATPLDVPEIRVSARNAYTSSTTTARACPRIFFLAARGSGQNPADAGYPAWANRLGDRGKRVWQGLMRQAGVGTSWIQPYGISYPAISLDWKALVGRWTSPLGNVVAYHNSVSKGVTEYAGAYRVLHGWCPSARFTLFGYSQGAEVVADFLQDPLNTTALRSRMQDTVLFADPRFNRADRLVNALPNGRQANGLAPARPLFASSPGLSTPVSQGRIRSWCSRTDDVCSYNSTGGLQWHGDEYDVYELWASYNLAVRMVSSDATKAPVVPSTPPPNRT
jgi:hypothetical protein